MRLRDIAFLAGGLILGFLSCYALISAIEAGRASKSIRALSEAMTISSALEAYRRDNGRYPSVASVQAALVPKYLRGLSTDQLTGQPYRIVMTDGAPEVIGVGRGGFVVKGGAVVMRSQYVVGDR